MGESYGLLKFSFLSVLGIKAATASSSSSSSSSLSHNLCHNYLHHIVIIIVIFIIIIIIIIIIITLSLSYHKHHIDIIITSSVSLSSSSSSSSSSSVLCQGCHGQGKDRENLWYCQSQWKVREFCFRYLVHKFSSRLWNAFSFGKDEKYAAKKAKLSIWHSTPDLCSSCGQWFSL